MRTAYRTLATVIITLGLVFLGGSKVSLTPPGYPIPLPEASVALREPLSMARVTYYNAVSWQTDDDPSTSACGPNLERQVAVSRDLFRSTLHCGDRVLVWADGEYHGEFVVWDTMSTRFEWTLDILTDTAYAFGKTTGHIVVID